MEVNTNVQQQEYSDEYIKEHWRELIMTHDDPDIDDDDKLPNAYIDYRNDKNSI